MGPVCRATPETWQDFKLAVQHSPCFDPDGVLHADVDVVAHHPSPDTHASLVKNSLEAWQNM